MSSGTAWEIAADTGGTFTDLVARDPAGDLHRVKVLSSSALRARLRDVPRENMLEIEQGWGFGRDLLSGLELAVLGRDARARVVAFDPDRSRLALDVPLPPDVGPGAAVEVRSPEQAPLFATRLVTGRRLDEPLPPLALRVGTTLATNALLTRSVAPAVLFISGGFGDLLRIGTQQRDDLFALAVADRTPLYAEVVEVRGRRDRDGAVLVPLDLRALDPVLDDLRTRGMDSAAVALIHADTDDTDERELEQRLRERGFAHVSRSSELAPEIRLLARAETAVVDATLGPVVARYLAELREARGVRGVRVMTSAGGLVAAGAARAKDMLLSGPAGGVVGAAAAGRRSTGRPLLAFDMGGTSTDVSRFDRDYSYVFEQRVGGAHLLAPALAIETVAAGGGSICTFDGQGLRVGPESAGAVPGPACYGAGGPLTVTDVNLLLGRLDPALFGIPVAAEPAARALEEVTGALAAATGERPEPTALLEGFLELANQRMAEAIREVSLRRGYDPSEHALVAFGGAGGQHATAIADLLGIDEVIVPADAGLLSAVGLAEAVVERFAERQVLAPLARVASDVPRWLDRLADEARAAASAEEDLAAARLVVRRRIASLRLAGQDATLDLEVDPAADLAATFAARYRALYGHLPADRSVELVSLRVVVSRPLAPPATPRPPAPAPAPAARGTITACFDGRWREADVHERDALAPGATVEGPVLVLEAHGATVVEPGWQLTVDAAGALVCRRARTGAAGGGRTERPEAVRLELFTHRFVAIARQMGEALRRTAVSTNVKERLDYSCALLDAAGRLVVNAPHIPVHLGSLGLCVRAVRERLALGPGDVAVTNHPAYGGSHLPDVTVVMPVHDGAGALVGHVAARAHHAEIGGRLPGSMPPTARRLAEEGVVIAPRHLARAGQFDWDGLARLLGEGPFPSRAVADNLADLEAAVAACHQGATALATLADAAGAGAIRHYMDQLRARARGRVAAVLTRLGDGERVAAGALDDGAPLRVTFTVQGERARVDFGGSGGVHPANLNATPAIVRSAVLYVLRLLVDEPLPLNEGLLEAVDLVVPPGLLNPPFPGDPAAAPAVVGGNVEVSQRLVGLLLRALGLAAASQETMNNVLFGDERFSYYETVCGGCGAGPGFRGASAVHSHMTNTRITDPEVLEHRFPVRCVRFGIRRGSGGRGRWPGGDGVVRELEFRAPLSLALLTQSRVAGPPGMAGGEEGAPGAQRVVRADGRVETLGPVDACEVDPGDRLVLETPGGGGWGWPPTDRSDTGE
jgi:5-oxoprolinase (ATP-hydrolysing)